ncbi:MAG: cytochrome c biogenesis protein ResB [Spirochaetales bacterium]
MQILVRLGSSRVSVALLGILFLVVLAGTLGQAVWGAATVQTTVFSQVFFWVQGIPLPGLPFWLGLTAVNLTLGAFQNLERKWTSAGLWLTHTALILFCVAGFGFAFVQEELVLGLPVGASANEAFLRGAAGEVTRPLPFTLTVEAFTIPRYEGSQEPSDYISDVRLTAEGVDHRARIQMNQPLRFGGLTIYQSSVQTVKGQTAPVYKITSNAWGFLPYLLSGLLFAGLGLHLVLRGRR